MERNYIAAPTAAIHERSVDKHRQKERNQKKQHHKMTRNSNKSNSSSFSFNDPLLIGGVISFIILIVTFQIMIAKVGLSNESKRRFQHAITGHALVQVSYVLPYLFCIVALSIGAIGFLVARTYYQAWFYSTFGPLLRPNELNGNVLPGAFYFLIGTVISALIAGENQLYLARYAVECLAIADPVASYVGSTISSPNICKGSSVSGSTACFITAVLVGIVMLGYNGTDNNNDISWTQLLLGALSCTIAEALPYGNDNLNIPIATTLAVLLTGER